jgi:methylmalonyl-CoA/ethylmalonyl-CoA epimerase
LTNWRKGRIEENEMLGRLNHIAIAVPDLEHGARIYASLLGAKVSSPRPEPDHGVRVVFVELPNTKIELLEPLGENSPIKAARDHLVAGGARVLGDGSPKIGAHGKPVLFLHPKDFCGTLVELEQA